MGDQHQGDGLTDIQRKYLRMVAAHYSSKEIAQLAGVTPKSVDRALDGAREKLGAPTRSSAARMLLSREEIGGSTPGEPFPLPEKLRSLKVGEPTNAGPKEAERIGFAEDRATFVHDLKAYSPQPARPVDREQRHEGASRSAYVVKTAFKYAMLILATLLLASAIMREVNEGGRELLAHLTH